MIEKEPIFQLSEAANILDIRAVRLENWIPKYFEPSVKARGSGTRNLFSAKDLKKISIFKDLVEYGFRRNKAAELVMNHYASAIKILNELKNDGA